jgi:AraC-like DNA-binding protein
MRYVERRGRAPSCSCFFINRGSAGHPYDLALHEHPFWQLELGVVGRFAVRMPSAHLALRPGLSVFFPPGTPHGFNYTAGVSYLSVKFHADVAETQSRTLDLRPRPMLRALERAVLAASAERRHLAVVDGVVAALFAACYRPEEGEGEFDSIEWQVRELVRERDGTYLTVAEVAEQVGYSPGHLSARFRSEHGVSLKAFLDRERARRAAEMVRYSDLSFGRIAYEMGFPDGFAFSRFFKRLHDVSPRAFRAAARDG